MIGTLQIGIGFVEPMGRAKLRLPSKRVNFIDVVSSTGAIMRLLPLPACLFQPAGS